MPGLDSSFLKAKRMAAEAAEERSGETEVFREISRLAAGPSSAFEVGPTSHLILLGKSLSPESMQGTASCIQMSNLMTVMGRLLEFPWHRTARCLVDRCTCSNIAITSEQPAHAIDAAKAAW